MVKKRKLKKKPFYFEDSFILGLYKANITFVWGDWDKYQTMLEKKHGLEKYKEKKGGNAVWIPPHVDYGALAHEAVHLANYIFESRGIKTYPDGEDEPFAFLVEWIVRDYLWIKDFRKKRNVKKK